MRRVTFIFNDETSLSIDLKQVSDATPNFVSDGEVIFYIKRTSENRGWVRYKSSDCADTYVNMALVKIFSVSRP